MYKYKLIGRAFLFGTAMWFLAMGFISAAVAGEDETEILNITVGEPTKLSNVVYTNKATVAVSRTGVVACQICRLGFHIVFSLDDGHTWQDRVSFSHLPESIITGQFDMVKAGHRRQRCRGNKDLADYRRARESVTGPCSVDRSYCRRGRQADHPAPQAVK